MDTFSDRVAALSPEKRRLLQVVYDEMQKNAVEISTISRQQSKKYWPLSFAQQRFWFFDQLMPGNTIYNAIAIALRMTGSLDITMLEQSLYELVRRHEILRTTFCLVDGKPYQTIHPAAPVKIAVVDLHAIPPAEREAEALKRVVADARSPFDLSQGPLFKVELMQINPQEYLFFVIMHHIITDHWSNEVLISEITSLYNAFVAGKPSPLPDLPAQYADFANWQRQWLQGEQLEKLLGYWKSHLAGDLPRLELPGSATHAERNFRGATCTQLIPSHLLERLRSLSQQTDATLYMMLLAVFQLLLYGYTEQTDILIGTPISLRNRVELEGMLGCFLNTLVLRFNLSGNPTFLELVKRVREETLTAYQHQDLPFERLVEALQPERKMAEMPFVQVAFNYIISRERRQLLILPGLQLTPVDLPDTMADIDLLLTVVEDANGLKVLFQYRSDLFTAEMMTTIAQQYCDLLEDVLSHPEHTCYDLSRRIVVEREAPHLLSDEIKSNWSSAELLESSNLTKNQLLFWMGQKLHPRIPLYNSISLFRMSRAIDPHHFQQAFQVLGNHIDVLRTVVEEIDGVPMQKLLPAAPCQMEYVDLSQDADPRASFAHWVQERCVRIFDLSKNLFDPVLLKLAPEEFVWYLAQHHIITDKWSTAIICRRLLDLYELSVRAELARETVEYAQFSEYIAYERAHRSSPEGVAAERYWQQKLENQPEPLNFYGKEPFKRTTLIERVSCSLGVERTRRLREMVTGSDFFVTLDLSLFQAFTTALFAYLYRISGNRRISIGSPFQMRPATFRDTVGPFSEARPLHVTIEQGETFCSLLQKVKAEIFDALKYAPFSSPNLNNTSYDVLLNYHPHITFPDMVQYQWHHVGHGNDSLNIQILSIDEAGSLQLLFDFHRDVFTEEQYDMVMQHFLGVIDAFIEDKAQLLDRIDFLTRDEKQQILAESKGPSYGYDEKIPHRLFERQVALTPEAIAVVYDDIQLSYACVNVQANRLAYQLQTLGAGPEQRIGLCLKRSPEMVIGMLGILKTGGAYIPLDPAYPKERLAAMTKAASISMLVTNAETKVRAFAPELPVITMESLVASEEHRWKDQISIPADGSHLFYIIFTSGSTGQPKGVAISQRGFANLLVWYVVEFDITAADRTLIISSLSFDLTQKNIFLPLAVGGAVHLLAAENADIPAISRTLQEQAITAFNCTPSLFYAVADDSNYAALRRCPALRYAFLGGEPIPGQKIKRYLEAVESEMEIVSTYGPTECTDVYSFYRPKGSDPEITTLLPIGKPIFNAQALILNQQLQLLPKGVTGELYLAGDGVGIGYINDTGHTASSFTPNPFSEVPGERLYKTGDQVRALPGGDIEFLSRVDFQVKIRGFRIELAEIETALRQHPAVREAIVLAREEAPGDKRLIAYIIPSQAVDLSHHELRSFLKERLPEYMLPSVFVMLSSLPLTSNNKIDRQALLKMDLSLAIAETDRILPRNAEEQLIASIWSELLGIDSAVIGIHDQFFNLGGHSLLAIQLATRLREVFDVEIPLITIFQSPTVEDLAIAVLQAKIAQVDSAEVAQLLEQLEPRSEEV